MFDSSRYSDNPITWSVPVGRLFGIRIRIHLLFLLIAFVIVLDVASEPTQSVLDGLAVVGILFGIVLLHEFGHCFGARYAGGEADEILLWPLGGLAYTQPPHRAGAHLVTTLAGPLVNVVICGATATFLIVNDPAHSFAVVPWNPFAPVILSTNSSLVYWTTYIFLISYIILLFNLVPMYPLDGGRVVQQLLWMRIGFHRSTLIACTTGMVGAIGVGLIGLVQEEMLLLGIAIFGYLTCWQQKQMLKMNEGLESSEFGYDFSQGYTSLEHSFRSKEPGKQPSRIQQWREARAERRRQREQLQREAEERRLDELLDKVHREGVHSLTPAERRFLDQISSRRDP